jgi:hypothetical protein
MLRDLFFKKKFTEKPKVSGWFRSVVETAAWVKLKETAMALVEKVNLLIGGGVTLYFIYK